MGRTTIVQTSFNSGELSPYMDVRVDQGRYATGCRVLRNMLLAPHGAAYRRPGLRYMGDAVEQLRERPVRLIPFVFNEEQAYVLEFGHMVMRVWYKSGLVLNAQGAPFELQLPYTCAETPLVRYCQSADVLYLVHENHPPQRLERFGHADWRLKAVSFLPAIAAPVLKTAVATGETGRVYSYVVTAVSAGDNEESLPSEPITCNASKSLSTTNYVTLTWDAVPDTREYRIFRGGGGSGSYGFIGRATGTTLVDRGQEADYGQGVPEAQEVFAGNGDYPSQVQFYQQRLCFAGTRERPQTIWASRTANYHNMNVSHPLQADDACTITIAADRVNAVRWMVASRKLLIGTVDGEWALAGYGGEPLSPSSCEVERQGGRGAAALPALTVGDSILYVQRGGNVVREFRYSLDTDGYGGVDLSILGEHILRHRRIVDWAWQQHPHSVVWCVLDDGTLAGLTLIREHEVVAWHRHDTQGYVESVTVIPGDKGDEVWMCVCRDVWDAATQARTVQRNVERLDAFFEGDNAVSAFFVDAGMSRQGDPVRSLSNLRHLEGKAVHILADGWVHPPCVVRDGCIDLERPASTIHVGLGFQSDIAPMASEPAGMQGTVLGMTRRVGRVRFRLYRSLGCKVGPNDAQLREVLFRHVQHPLGEALPLFTGDHTALIDSTISTSGGVFFRQDDPLPFTLMSVAHEVEVGEM